MHESNKHLNRRNVLKGTLAVAAAPALITSARAQPKIQWKLQSHWPKGVESFRGSLGVLGRELEARTDGRFEIEFLGAGEIAKGPEIFNVVRRGVVQMGTTSSAYNLGESELQGMYYGVPGSLRDPWEMMHLTKNLGLEAAINKLLEPRGVFYLADKAYPTELVLKDGIEPGTDLSGIKVRSTGTMLEFLAAAGFAPQFIDGAELYQAIATGIVDGAHWGGAAGALGMKLWEVAKVHMQPALMIANDVYIINTEAYEKLPEDLRVIFRSLVEERYFARSVDYKYQEAIALNTGLSKMGVRVEQFPADVLARFAEASQAALAKEVAKGPAAKEYGEKLSGLMKELGYL
ncbi:MAG: substrate-binding domain-containing protein [Burkholderiaceae bacterium]